jgi:hypothetical protein
MQRGTRVLNPVHRRHGDAGYSKCIGCGRYYTELGISRHWPWCRDLIQRPNGSFAPTADQNKTRRVRSAIIATPL